MLNAITLMGRMTRDPELRTTNGGVSVTSFTLAVDRDGHNASGEKVTDFIPCIAWRQTAEFVVDRFGKGRMTVVEGRLQSRRYVDEDGKPHTQLEVVVDNIYFADSQRREPAEEQAAE
jgi:single-strand DNA-binding protein